MKVEFKGLRELTDKLVKVQAVTQELPAMAAQVEGEALGYLIVQAGRNVYDTPAGAYQRTGDYLRGMHAKGNATRFRAQVRVWNEVAYAGAIETGTGPHEMSVAQLLAQAQGNPNPAAPLYLGRTGEKFSLPGPAMIPATVFARYRLVQLFAQKVWAVMR